MLRRTIDNLSDRIIQNKGCEVIELDDLGEYNRLYSSELPAVNENEHQVIRCDEIDRKFTGPYIFYTMV